jgi:2-(3-amino-3-carboxypropyl)histidine synthase
VVLGTLGRQGNPRILETVQRELAARGRAWSTFLMSEISPQKIRLFEGVDAWVQIACPRLSIDWGEGFHVPVLTPYEALVALGTVPAFWEEEAPAEGPGAGVQRYPMDYYAKDGGEWSSSYLRGKAGPPAAGPRPGSVPPAPAAVPS